VTRNFLSLPQVWRMLIAHIIDHIRDGFETELRLHRRRTSALLAGSGGPAVMAMAPLESRFCKWVFMAFFAIKKSNKKFT
jgi:hypothetical protein